MPKSKYKIVKTKYIQNTYKIINVIELMNPYSPYS